MIPPTSIDGTDITGATIDGTDVTEITVDGQTVFTAGPQVPDAGNLIFHLDASQESLSNNATTATLTDFSGAGNDSVSSSTTATYKTNGIGGQPAFDFDASGFFETNVTLTRPITISAAVDLTQGNDNEIVQAESASNFVEFSNRQTDTYALFGGSNSSGFVQQTLSATHPIPMIAECDSSNNNKLNVDGTNLGNASGFSFNVSPARLPDNDVDGLIAEVTIHQSTGIISDMNDYFNDKYGI